MYAIRSYYDCDENLNSEAGESCNKRNRRIELRFVMATPEPEPEIDWRGGSVLAPRNNFV